MIATLRRQPMLHRRDESGRIVSEPLRFLYVEPTHYLRPSHVRRPA